MSVVEQNKALIRAHFDAIWSGNDAALREQLAEDFVDHTAPPGMPKGPGAVIEWASGMRAVFPDMKVVIEQIVAEGDRVAVYGSWAATHSGPFQGIPATHKAIRFTGMVFWRAANGKIAERWGLLDMPSVMRQLQA